MNYAKFRHNMFQFNESNMSFMQKGNPCGRCHSPFPAGFPGLINRFLSHYFLSAHDIYPMWKLAFARSEIPAVEVTNTDFFSWQGHSLIFCIRHTICQSNADCLPRQYICLSSHSGFSLSRCRMCISPMWRQKTPWRLPACKFLIPWGI